MTVDHVSEPTAARDTNRWLSPQEVCDELRIPKQTFYQWRARHVAPPAYRFGKLLRIDRAEFDEWLSNHAESFDSRHAADPGNSDSQ